MDFFKYAFRFVGREPGFNQIVGFDTFEGFSAIETGRNQSLREAFFDTDLCESRSSSTDLLTNGLRTGCFFLNHVDFPPNQTRSQTDVLAFPSDRDGKILFGNFKNGAMIFLIEGDAFRHGRFEHFDDHLFRVATIRNDIDLFAAQFANNTLHASAAGADTSANRIHFGIGGAHRYLRAITWFARERFDFHRAVCDFGHFDFEKTAHETAARAAENKFRAARRGIDRHQQTTDTLTRGVLFARDLLLAGQHGFRLTEIDKEVIALATADSTRYYIADEIFEVIVDTLFFELTKTLHDRLASGLRSNAPEIGRIDCSFNEFTDLSAGFKGLRLLDVNFNTWITDRIDHFKKRPSAQLAIPRIDIDFELLAGVHTFLGGTFDRIHDCGDHVGATDTFLLLHVFKDG